MMSQRIRGDQNKKAIRWNKELFKNLRLRPGRQEKVGVNRKFDVETGKFFEELQNRGLFIYLFKYCRVLREMLLCK